MTFCDHFLLDMGCLNSWFPIMDHSVHQTSLHISFEQTESGTLSVQQTILPQMTKLSDLS